MVPCQVLGRLASPSHPGSAYRCSRAVYPVFRHSVDAQANNTHLWHRSQVGRPSSGKYISGTISTGTRTVETAIRVLSERIGGDPWSRLLSKTIASPAFAGTASMRSLNNRQQAALYREVLNTSTSVWARGNLGSRCVPDTTCRFPFDSSVSISGHQMMSCGRLFVSSIKLRCWCRGRFPFP